MDVTRFQLLSGMDAKVQRRVLRLFTPLVLLVLLSFSWFIGVPQAHAAGTAYYINNQSGSNCSDSGSGTSQSQPWCDFTPVNASPPEKTRFVSVLLQGYT